MGERTREGNDLYNEMTESGVIDKTTMVFGQMNEPPAARLRVALSGLAMAEFFRDDEGRDVLLFVVEEHLCRKILERIANVAGFDKEPGKGIAIQINVEDAVGVAQQVERLKDKVEEEL